MSTKFTADDLFRIAEENLSAVEKFDFRFRCETAAFRRRLADSLEDLPNVNQDEKDLLERIFRKIGGGIFKGSIR